MKINFIYSADSLSSVEKKETKKAIKNITSVLLKEEKTEPELISFIFCDDRMIREYNSKYLGHDFETDIITFYDKDDEGITEGELLISLDTVRANSVRYGTEFYSELFRVAVHGLLHLCGYNDKTGTERKIIKAKEDYYLNKLNNAGKNI
ncbi:MAG: rRNA maturation RNase YbeY [Bacteroidetes bacterium]|nr:rRNA maturation RNase YbeY [Bacteroidota bacterium]